MENDDYTAWLIIWTTKVMNQPLSEFQNWLKLPLDLLLNIVDKMDESKEIERDRNFWKDKFGMKK